MKGVEGLVMFGREGPPVLWVSLEAALSGSECLFSSEIVLLDWTWVVCS